MYFRAIWNGGHCDLDRHKSKSESCKKQWWSILPAETEGTPLVKIITQNNSNNSFIHLVVCLTTGPKPLPKRAIHIVRSRASLFKWEYTLLSWRSSSSFLSLLPHLPLTFIPPFIFNSITRFRRQFLRKMWPIQLAFRLLISCRIFLCSLTLSNTRLSQPHHWWYQ